MFFDAFSSLNPQQWLTDRFKEAALKGLERAMDCPQAVPCTADDPTCRVIRAANCLLQQGQELAEEMEKNPELKAQWEQIQKRIRSFKIPEKVGAQLAGTVSTVAEEYLKNLDSQTIGQQMGLRTGEGVRTFVENLKLSGTGGALGKEMHQAALEVSPYIAPWIAGGLALGTSVPLLMLYGYKVAVNNLTRPRLPSKTRNITVLSRMTDLTVGALYGVAARIFPPHAKDPTPVFNEAITRRVRKLGATLDNLQRNGGYLQNVLFYGPPGTGKTMLAEHLTEHSRYNYLMMSGGDLAQFIARKEHVTELNKILDQVENASRPTILLVDEAEGLCQNRDKVDADRLDLINAFLKRTGSPSKKLMLMLITNREKDLDPAVLDRIDHKIHIDLPALEERKKMVAMYADHFFTDSEVARFFAPKTCAVLAEKFDGMSGRAIFKVVNVIYGKKAASENDKLTQAMIDGTVQDFLE